MADQLLDLKDSTLVLEGDEKTREAYLNRIKTYQEQLKKDVSSRREIYTKRRDFYSGNHHAYSNVTGIIKDTKQKKGHTNAITNYAGRTVFKIATGLANNPPTLNCIPLDTSDPLERTKAQGVQDAVESILNDRENRFWKKTYRRTSFNQAILGDGAFRVFPIVDTKKIKIVEHDDMSKISVGWNGVDPHKFDFVIAETLMTADAVETQWGIKVNRKLLPEMKKEEATAVGSWETAGAPYGKASPQAGSFPTGSNDLAKLKVIEFDSNTHYCIIIEGEMVQYIEKDDINFPKGSFWIIVPNIPNPPSNWSIADIDYLIEPQIELNDNNNRTSDYIRVGGVQRYVAVNLQDFDPESIKTSSGQVIFVNSPDGNSRFEPLPTNVNNFPADQYHTRKLNEMYDMGLPKVNFGASGADSGRSKAIDYQSSIDLTIFKRDAWELALYQLCEKIQIYLHFLYPDMDIFEDENGEFVVRDFEFDWTDILPISQSDKIVNIANKFSMIGIPLRQAFKELGYRNPEAMVEELKAELSDPLLMTIRAKAWQLSEGLLQAQNQAATQAQSQGSDTPPPTATPNQPSPMMQPEQSDVKMPMARAMGTSASTAAGQIDKARQNMAARGQ